MKTETGSSASFASRAAAAVSVRLASAALAAVCAAAAASRFACASALAASSCVPRSAALAATFCLASSVRALSWSVLAAASIFSAKASSASARVLSISSLRTAAGAAAASRAAKAAAALASSAALAASAASRASVSARAGAAASASAFGTNSFGSENATGSASFGAMITRMPICVLPNKFFGKVIGHADAAVRRRIAGQGAAMQRDARPGDALHVRHPGIVVEVGVVVLVLLDDAEDAGRGLASLDAGRNRRAKNPAVGVVDRHLLALDRHDRHDRLAGIARRRRLGGARGSCQLRRGVSGRRRRQRHQHGRNGRNTVVNRCVMAGSIAVRLAVPLGMFTSPTTR